MCSTLVEYSQAFVIVFFFCTARIWNILNLTILRSYYTFYSFTKTSETIKTDGKLNAKRTRLENTKIICFVLIKNIKIRLIKELIQRS